MGDFRLVKTLKVAFSSNFYLLITFVTPLSPVSVRFCPSNVSSPKLSLQVLAERYRHKYPTGSAYVSAFEARPMLHVKPERHKRFTELNFVEAVREDPNPTVEELIPAYRVAGDGFVGKMKSLFIILDDDEAAKQPWKAANIKKKNKRHASGDSASGSKKKTLPATQ
jgi:hypothetical protein